MAAPFPAGDIETTSQAEPARDDDVEGRSRGSSRTFVVCCDGTGEKPTGNAATDSNPARIARIVAKDVTVGYQQGIGTLGGEDNFATKFNNLFSLALGNGLDYNSFKVCEWLMQQNPPCGPEDQVILVGFSRGAFTQRIVAQFISEVGLLPCAPGEVSEDYTQRYWVVFFEWFFNNTKSTLSKDALDRAQAGLDEAQKSVMPGNYNPPFQPQRLALALFDTVATNGAPGDLGKILAAATDEVDALAERWSFIRNDLPSAVTFARHALALGEKRSSFPAFPMSTTHQDLKQRWFPGVHTCVGGGGGNPDNQIASFDALAFMVGELQDNGFQIFDQGVLENMVPLIANEVKVAVITMFKSSTTALYVLAGETARKPGNTGSNEEVQAADTDVQQRLKAAGAKMDAPTGDLEQSANGTTHARLLQIAMSAISEDGQEPPIVPENMWIQSASSSEAAAEYKRLTMLTNSTAEDGSGSQPKDSTTRSYSPRPTSGMLPAFPSPSMVNIGPLSNRNTS